MRQYRRSMRRRQRLARRSHGGHSKRRYRRSMWRRQRSCGVTGDIGDCRVGITPQLSRMENWNQDLPERYSKFCGLYIKFQGHGKWPWTWWGPRKRQGYWPRPPLVIEVAESMYKYCKHILKFSNCVLLRVPINNDNYEQPIALFVIIPAKNTFINQYGVI